MRAEMDRMLVELAKVPFLEPVPSDSNFVLCKVLGLDATLVYDELRARGIIIRYFGAQGEDSVGWQARGGNPIPACSLTHSIAIRSGLRTRRWGPQQLRAVLSRQAH